MKKINIIFLMVLSICSLSAQVIRFERTDVDSKDANFVTATKSFGIDIKIDSIEHCSNVTFELSHNMRGVVKLSEWSKSMDWLVNNEEQIVTIVKEFSYGDSSLIAVECGTGVPPNALTRDNPMVIHLEFVVSPDAVHNQMLEFKIGKIKATYFADSIIELTIPEIEVAQYNLHSYVIVMPGDADCNGKVDIDDWAIVSKYLTEPDASRAFRRVNPTILWQPQRCIAWDTLAATYADCDGNGMITTSDYNVIKLNYLKENFSYSCNIPYQGTINNKVKNNMQTVDTKIIPITISDEFLDCNFTGIAGVINLSKYKESKVLKIEAGNYFTSNDIDFHYYINNETNLTSFCWIGDKMNDYNNVVAYVTIENNGNINTFDINQYVGFDVNDNVTQLTQSVTSIDEDREIFDVYYNNDLLYINTNENISKLLICDLLGSSTEIYNHNTSNQYDISHLQNGIYFVIAYTTNKVLTAKIIVR